MVFLLPSESASYSVEIDAEPEVSHETVWTFDTLVTHLAEKYHQDENLARRIIFCESENLEGNTNDNIEDGVVWSIDWGYWQINDYWNLEHAASLGYDIRYNWQDNLEYGFILLRDRGTQPWDASAHCWNK